MTCRLSLALLAAAVVSGCGSGTATDAPPLASDAVAPAQVDTEPAVAVLTLALVGAKDTKPGPSLRFRLTNSRAVAVQFSGFRSDSPRMQIDQLTPTGWEPWHADWCGTGAKYYDVPAGGSLEFEIKLAERPGPFRAGVYCRDETVWSSKVDLDRSGRAEPIYGTKSQEAWRK
jgi:hypothetical protein